MTVNRDAADWGLILPQKKNLIINGDFSVAQRGTSIVGAGVAEYTLDRWVHGSANTTAVVNVNQGNVAFTNAPFKYGLYVDVTTADATVGSTDVDHITQKIEGLTSSVLAFGSSSAKTVTVSFWHAHTKTGTHCVGLRNSAGTRAYIAEYTQSAADTWEYSTVTIPGDTSGAWAVDTTWGVALTFAMMCGTTYQTTANTWSAGNYIATANQVNNMDSASNFFRIGNVQLEIGDQATDFEVQRFDEVLAACKRYYQKSCARTTVAADLSSNDYSIGTAYATTAARVVVNLEVEMRNNPTVTVYQPGAGGTAGQWSYYNGSSWVDFTSTTVASALTKTILIQGVGTFTLYDSLHVLGTWVADAEI